jgi:hypothetical protein
MFSAWYQEVKVALTELAGAQAHEDAERAVRTGLALIEAVSKLR